MTVERERDWKMDGFELPESIKEAQLKCFGEQFVYGIFRIERNINTGRYRIVEGEDSPEMYEYAATKFFENIGELQEWADGVNTKE